MHFNARRFAGNPRLQQASNSKPSIRRGESGDAVKIVQQALVDLGFAMPRSTNNGHSLTDGRFGPETERVVKEFQKRSGLVADGVVGQQTMAMLDKMISIQSKFREAEELASAGELFTCGPVFS